MTVGTTLSSTSGDLDGFRVLVVEDDYIVAQEVSSTLRERGAMVVGPVPDVAKGRSLAETNRIDCALLDVNLKGQLVFDLAHLLIDKGIRPIFTTGYDTSFLPADLRDSVCLQKPVDTEDLVRSILEGAPARSSRTLLNDSE
jgi:DNA-binding response OmpR family regulator